MDQFLPSQKISQHSSSQASMFYRYLQTYLRNGLCEINMNCISLLSPALSDFLTLLIGFSSRCANPTCSNWPRADTPPIIAAAPRATGRRAADRRQTDPIERRRRRLQRRFARPFAVQIELRREGARAYLVTLQQLLLFSSLIWIG